MAIFALSAAVLNAQDFRERYEQFKQQATQKHDEFRAKVNQEYADFLKSAWEQFSQQPARKKPEEKPVPPVVLPDDDKTPAPTVRPLVIDTVVKPMPMITVQPKPVAPIREVPPMDNHVHHFTFYGTRCDVRMPEIDSDFFRSILGDKATEEQVAKAWTYLSTNSVFDNTVRDCLMLRIKHQLDDYAYLLMLRELGETFFNGAGNDATMLAGWIFCQSGYKMRFGMDNGKLVLLFATNHVIYDLPYYYIDGTDCYALLHKGEQLNTLIHACKAPYPGEQPLSLAIGKPIRLTDNESELRTITSRRYREMSVKVSVNKNLVNYFADYLPSYVNDDPLTRWAMLANTPLQETAAEMIAEQMKPLLQGKTQLEAVNMLLNWVQTGFEYEYDNKLWGGDRAFFAEETLYYPYCDCEDRSILFTRLVRNLTGLKCALVYYPGHLAAAVCFDEEVKGDYLRVGNEKYTIADPTFINAAVGRTMTSMADKPAQVILLQ